MVSAIKPSGQTFATPPSDAPDPLLDAGESGAALFQNNSFELGSSSGGSDDKKPDVLTKPASASIAERVRGMLSGENKASKIVPRVLGELGVQQIRVVIPDDDVHCQAKKAGDVKFEAAFQAAMRAVLGDSGAPSSPLALVRAQSHGDDAAASKQLSQYLNTPKSLVALVRSDAAKFTVDGDVVGRATHGESVQDNWVFCVYVKDVSPKPFWVIVPRQSDDQGHVRARVYGTTE